MNRRVLTVAAAVLLAVLGTVGLFIYVNQADIRAIGDQQAVTTLIADKAVPSGTTAAEAERAGLLRTITLPAGSVPPEALAEISPDLGSLVIGPDLAPGQLLLRPMLVTSGRPTGGLTIPEGMVAVSIALCLPEAVAGHVRPGASVAVFTTVVAVDGAEAKPGCDGEHKQQGEAFTRVVLPKVEVLSIGPSPAESTDGSEVQRAASTTSTAGPAEETVVMTVAVNQDDAERVITLTRTGLPYLALLGDSSQIAPDTRIVDLLPPLN